MKAQWSTIQALSLLSALPHSNKEEKDIVLIFAPCSKVTDF